MFPQEVHADVEQFGCIQCTFSIPGICRRMCTFSFEGHRIAHYCLRALHVCFVFVVWVPVETDIQVVENTRSRHIDFSCQVFFSRCAVKADSSFQFSCSNQFFDCRCGTQAGSSEHVVTTTMTTATFLVGSLGRLGFLRQTRKGIKFTQNADDWFTGTIFCNEGRRNFSNIPSDLETLFFSIISQYFC